MTPEEVKGALEDLHERYDIQTIADIPLTIPGKGHWLWGLYTPMYPK
jgi:hypothetical protein